MTILQALKTTNGFTYYNLIRRIEKKIEKLWERKQYDSGDSLDLRLAIAISEFEYEFLQNESDLEEDFSECGEELYFDVI
jgi:hypothetical protein